MQPSTQRGAIDDAGVLRELGGQLLKPISKRDRCLMRVVDRDGLEVANQSRPLALMAGLKVDLHHPKPAEEAPTTVLRRPCVGVVNLHESRRDHVKEMVEPSPRGELPWRAYEVEELIGIRLAAGSNREFGDLLGVRQLARDGDRKAALDQGVGSSLGDEIRSNECGNQLVRLLVAPDESRRAANGYLKMNRRQPLRRPRRDHEVIHARRRRLLERDAVWRPFAQLGHGPGSEKTNEEHRPQAVLEPRAASARRVRACGGRVCPHLVRHGISSCKLGFTDVDHVFAGARAALVKD
ncbi:MAG: hypothetical protein H0W56_00145 [Acidothermales bacterium]|nr:hypothetical protein [Acidothermales bacterium]